MRKSRSLRGERDFLLSAFVISTAAKRSGEISYCFSLRSAIASEIFRDVSTSLDMTEAVTNAILETGVVDDRALANQHTARFGACAIESVEDHEITGKASAVSRGEFGRSWIALPLDA
jgi:hypothetical protein